MSSTGQRVRVELDDQTNDPENQRSLEASHRGNLHSKLVHSPYKLLEEKLGLPENTTSTRKNC